MIHFSRSVLSGLLFLSLTAISQNTEKLILSPSCNSDMPFIQVNVLDKREPGQTLGFVDYALRKKATIVLNENFEKELASFFQSKNTLQKPSKELLIVLNELYVSMKDEGLWASGRLRLNIQLYVKNALGLYAQITGIDSVYVIKESDVRLKLLKSVSLHLCELAGRASLNYQNPAKSVFTFQELEEQDSLVKSALPVYTAPQVKAGIYKTYDQFKNNAPESQNVIIDTSHETLLVYTLEGKKKRYLESKDCYAVSDGVVLVKGTTMGFYRMQKRHTDFYYDGITSFFNPNPKNGNNSNAGAAGALAVSLLLGKPNLARFKLDYMKGHSIPIALLEEN